MRFGGTLLLLSMMLMTGGCKDSGPKRFRVSGEAVFNGAPIPHGDVLFTPDGGAGNSGPQGIASIKDGRFDTSAEEGKGVAGGPTIVRVTGLTGPGGKVICEFEYTLDLPKSDTTIKVEPPAGTGGAVPPPPKKGALPEI